MKRRTFAGAMTVLGTGLASTARAQPAARRYATMSLVGDQLTAVERNVQVGSHLSRNVVTEIKVNGDIIDRAALGTINALIANAQPGAKPVSLLIDEPVLYQQQARLFDGEFVRLPLEVRKAALDGAATHMLLLTKQRTTLSFAFDVGGRSGDGSASGLGFYIDPEQRVRDLDNNRRTEGFLGLFVHLRATVFALDSERIVGSRNVVLTDMYLNTREGFGGLPWNALSPQQKIQAVSDLMLKALRENVPPLLQG